MAKTIRTELIKALASGQFVSGQQMADVLGVSRTAIANQISSLCEMGLDIFKVRGKGYQLAHPLTLLDANAINYQLKGAGFSSPVEIHTIIDSTNSYLMRKLPNHVSNGQVCLAEYQEAGRGRRGRQWISPFGSHLYLSMYQHLPQGMAQAMGLSLVVGLAVKDCLTELYRLNVGLKWPNDVYLDGKKLAGILIELEGQTVGECQCVIGIGINVNMPDKVSKSIDQPWTDIATHVPNFIDRNQLAASLIKSLHQRIEQHKAQGFVGMQDDWHQHDIFYNKSIDLHTGEKVISGICRGVNEQGALLMEVEGLIKPIYGGEVSVRAAV